MKHRSNCCSKVMILVFTLAFLFVAGVGFAGGLKRSTTRTGPGGNTATTTHTQEWGVQDGAYERQSEHTGPGGQSVSSTKSTTKTETGYDRSQTVTGPGGRSSTKNTSVDRY